MWLSTVVLVLLQYAVFAQANSAWATAINRVGWTVTADSAAPGMGAGLVLDNNNATFWQTTTGAALPHTITIDMKKTFLVNGVSYLPRQNSSNGYVAQHTWSISNDGKTFTTVIFGNYDETPAQKTSYFSKTTARYVRLTAQASQSKNQQISAADIKVYSPNTGSSPTGFAPPAPHTYGRWDVTVDIPLVPAAGAVTRAGTLVFWSAWRPNQFEGSGGIGETDTALWNPATQYVTRKLVTQTGHDMFCPGISLDKNGQIVVTGGISDKETSIYDPSTAWSSAAPMTIGRGYQASVTIGDGRIFTIGGSWSGGVGGKNGEIYSPAANTWSYRPGCLVAPMLTQDKAPQKQDNHAWLFAWKSNSIFQAGPSSAMNWYNVSGSGSQLSAGNRASDPDSMCGNAVMYDAVKGKIFTVGGAPYYAQSQATSNAHIITLTNPNTRNTSVATIQNARYARIFANSIVLPDGKIFIVGGQSYSMPFTDTTPQFIPEMFNPLTLSYSNMAPLAEPRTYHSIGLLLPDGRVFSGGGGLCPTDACLTNHFDGQIYSPPYLFTSSGALAPRPVIESVSSSILAPGAKFTATTNSGVSSFSLIRIGSATHTVNTDQRRIALTPTASGNTYTFTLPSDPGVAVPGYWYLFAVNAAGVPSVAKIVQIT